MRPLLLFLLALPAFAANYPNQVSVLLDAGAKTITVQNSGTGGADVPFRFAPAGTDRIRYTISPIYVPPPSGTTYSTCADPCSVSLNRNWGQQYYWVEYVKSDGTEYSPRKLTQPTSSYGANACGGTGTLPQVELATITTAPLPMPIEAIGQDCYVTRVQLPLVNGHASTSLRLYLRVASPGYNSNLRPDGKISVQLGSAAWLNLTNATATAIDEQRYYSKDLVGIGTFPQVREFTLPIPDGTIGSGDTTVTVGLRFNGTEGIGSGARILALNIIEADKTVTTLSIASNAASAAVTAHGYSSGNTVLIQNGMGMYSRFSGLRSITGVTTNAFTFAPCGTSLTGSSGCTSPDILTSDARAFPPINRDLSGNRSATQEVMHAARCIIATSAFTAATMPSAAPGGADATAGGNLWRTGNDAGTNLTDQLVLPVDNYSGHVLHSANCASCHLQDGSDLKIFNYSNWSIKQRTIFHGFTGQQGDNVAAYIRGLQVGVPVNGRPWNPPFQPGPGLSKNAWAKSNSTLTNIVASGTTMTVNFGADPGFVVGDPLQISGATVDADLNTLNCPVLTVGSNSVTCGPVANVTATTYTESTLLVSAPLKLVAGAGIDSVINDGFASLLEYLPRSGGSIVNGAWNQRLETRDIPTIYQLASWDQWIPVFFPGDTASAFGYDFFGSTCYTKYQDVLANQTPNSFSSWQTFGYSDLWSNSYGACGALRGAQNGSFPGGSVDNAKPGQLSPSNLTTRFMSSMQYSAKAVLDVAVTKGTLCMDGLRVQALYGGSATPDASSGWPIACNLFSGVFFELGVHKSNVDGFTLSTFDYPPWLDRVHGFLDGSAGVYPYQDEVWYFFPFIAGTGNGHGVTFQPFDPAYLTGLNMDVMQLRPNGWITMLPIIATVQTGNQWTDFLGYSGASGPVIDWSGVLGNQQWHHAHSINFAWMSDADRALWSNDYLDVLLAMFSTHDAAYWSDVFPHTSDNASNNANAYYAFHETHWNGSIFAMYLTYFRMMGADSGKLATFKTFLNSLSAYTGHDFQIDLDAGNDATCPAGGDPNMYFGQTWLGAGNVWWLCSNMVTP